MKENPELLYHYTDQAGLLGIIKSRTLWATGIHYLNDAKEVWHAFNIMENEIIDRLSQTDDLKIKEKLEALKYKTNTILGINVYVSSFSEREDALSQWRSYVGNQPGFAIGFNFDKLKKVSEKNGFNLYPCIYDQFEQGQKLGKLLDSFMATDFETRRPYLDPDKPLTFHVPKIGGDFMDKLAKIALLLKHNAFEDEKEWRLVSEKTKSYEIRFRPSTSLVTPYVEINLNTEVYISCLERVVVGPSPHKELALRSVQELFYHCEYIDPKPEIISSDAPFRYW